MKKQSIQLGKHSWSRIVGIQPYCDKQIWEIILKTSSTKILLWPTKWRPNISISLYLYWLTWAFFTKPNCDTHLRSITLYNTTSYHAACETIRFTFTIHTETKTAIFPNHHMPATVTIKVYTQTVCWNQLNNSDRTNNKQHSYGKSIKSEKSIIVLRPWKQSFNRLPHLLPEFFWSLIVLIVQLINIPECYPEKKLVPGKSILLAEAHRVIIPHL